MKKIRNRVVPIFLIMLCFISVDIAFAEPPEKKQATYPETPIKVVEAFIETGLRDATNEEKMSLCDEFLRPQYKYLPDEEDKKSNSKTHVLDLAEPWGPCINKYHIVTGFETKEEKRDKNKTVIKVIYKRLGWIWDTPKNINKCYASVNNTNVFEKNIPDQSNKKKGWVWDKDGCKFLYITNDTHAVSYHLAKPGKLWRITDCYEPHISVNAAIKLLECEIRKRPSVSTTYPSAEQTIEIKKDIETLK